MGLISVEEKESRRGPAERVLEKVRMGRVGRGVDRMAVTLAEDRQLEGWAMASAVLAVYALTRESPAAGVWGGQAIIAIAALADSGGEEINEGILPPFVGRMDRSRRVSWQAE